MQRSYNKLFIFFAVIVFSVQCFFDAQPPGTDKLYDQRVQVVLHGSGFSAGARIFVRFHDARKSYAWPDSLNMVTDISGQFVVTISAAQGSSQVDYLLYVDQNYDNKWDNADFGLHRSVVVNNQSRIIESIAYVPNTLRLYQRIETQLPASGKLTCVFMPSGEGVYNGEYSHQVPDFPVMTNPLVKLSFYDWFPAADMDAANTVINYLVSGSYNESCIEDINSNGYYDTNETIRTAINITIP